jgi:5-methylcytosine-specific restriction endonuclease McrA
MNSDEAKRAHTDRMIAEAVRSRQQREQGYRERALKLYPWICGRCGREFAHGNLHQLTVHHRDHNHDNNPRDGSNWELLCLYCHDNEHARELDDEAARQAGVTDDRESGARATSQPFADLKELLRKGR